MPIKIQLVFENDTGGLPVVQEVAQIERDGLSPASLGLTLTEAKTVLHCLQEHLVEQQVSRERDLRGVEGGRVEKAMVKVN
jgi:hypothetical protein